MTYCHKINDLLSGYLDNELTQGDQQRVEVHLRECDKCRQILDDMTRLQGVISQTQSRPSLPEERWDQIMNDLPSRASQGLGWILLIAGAVTLLGLAIWEFAIDDQVTLPVKLAVAGVWFGLLFLFMSVLRQRLLSWKTDKYKDVKY